MLDEHHAGSRYSHYLFFDAENTLMQSPIVYSKDSITFGKELYIFGFIFNYTPMITLPINGTSATPNIVQDLFHTATEKLSKITL